MDRQSASSSVIVRSFSLYAISSNWVGSSEIDET
jgi:hypothetical protein